MIMSKCLSLENNLQVLFIPYIVIICEGQYERTRDFETCKASFKDLFIKLKTDYIDIGMVHYVDDENDFNTVFSGKII